MFKDFTLKAYERYLQAIKTSFPYVLRFEEYFLLKPKPERFCLIRHDVDRKPQNALAMAMIENELDIKATYYFRVRQKKLNSEVITQIANMGHEIGYHYESLSDADGDMERALEDFRSNLEKLRQITEVKTISMHGAPLKPFDNRDLWRDSGNHELLVNELKILGEIYLDIDYSDIVYINDTGRNWNSTRSNLRDQVKSNTTIEFETGELLYEYLVSTPNPRLVFQVHPERWTDKRFEYCFIFFFFFMVNVAKYLIKWCRS